MKTDILVSADVRARQRAAADPEQSVWVSANAGAGKTTVLTERVIRLLLAGTPPSRILCLTFTKAAAAEMTGRVFGTLGNWVTMTDDALGRALHDMTGKVPGRAVLAQARRLFARAVETPGGLKIETIHAFCERLLHLVPFEAGVPAGFAVLDDGQAAEIFAEAQAAVLARAASGEPRHAPLAAWLDTVAALTPGPRLPELLAAAVADRRIPDQPAEIEALVARLGPALGLALGQTAATVRRQMAEDGIPPSEWDAVAAELRATGKPSDAAQAAKLALAARSTLRGGRLTHYWSVFFTDKDEPRAYVVTRSVPEALRTQLVDEQARLVGLRPELLAAEAAERSAALFRLAGAIRQEVAAIKARRGALDFDDLIRTTLSLFERGEGPWVLYRLDRGIDHVLIDEAQDTNPEQWRILQRLTEEFTAGTGRPTRGPRTVFAVGDPKQSIYSFQGADPREFEGSRRHWRTKHDGAGLPFGDVRLDLSFRSAALVLETVDATFAPAANYKGLAFDDAAIGTRHTAARVGAPGQVEIWPTEMPAPSDKADDAWSLPLDTAAADSPAVVAARRVAEAVRTWTRDGDPASSRHWRPGDILVLARKRGPAFFAVIRALKAAGVPVAGADRIDVNEQIAVLDLLAAGGAALLPANDLVLASALKSPLVGLDDDDLIRIAAARPDGQSLAAALDLAAEAGNTRAADAAEILRRWQDLATRLGPFGFYATLLGPDGGRRRLVERLGGEAADAVDVFLSRAQTDEFGPEPSSLTTFLARFEAAAHVIRRDPEAAGDRVRVMTVHGAKGLEASLVVLLDGCEVGGTHPALLGVEPGPGQDAVPVWALGPASDPPALQRAREVWRERAGEEHNRLLYVALTRARDRLVLVPYTDGRSRPPKPETWCEMVRRGFVEASRATVRTEMPYGPVDLVSDGSEAGAHPSGAPRAAPPTILPDWLTRPVASDPEPLPPLRPSGPLAAADRPDPDRAPGGGRARGRLVHALLDRLVELAGRGRLPGDVPWLEDGQAAEAILATLSPMLGEGERTRIAAEALGVLRHPELAALFGPGSRGEVALSGRVGPPGRERDVTGRVDRLLVAPEAVLVADFKTGHPPTDGSVPDAYLSQLAIYRAVLSKIDVARAVRALLVWTGGPVVVEPLASALDAALSRTLGPLP